MPSVGAAPATSPAGDVSPGAAPAGDIEVSDGAGGGGIAGDAPAEAGDAPASSPASPASPAGSGDGDDPNASAASPRDQTAEPVDPSNSIDRDASATGILVIGLAAIAGVAIAGVAILLFLRRRQAEEDLQSAAATAILDRPRASRRSPAFLEDDPIIAALGIDAAPVRQRREGRVDHGGARSRRR
jgi:hypothetical protein